MVEFCWPGVSIALMPSYDDWIRECFDQLRNGRCVRERVDIGELKMVIFSDHHRGDQTGADDFLRCRDVYHEALSHYHEEGYKLVLLGDVEELWETTPGVAVDLYADTLREEQKFAKTGRYWRLFGNHDDTWASEGAVKKYLADFIPDETGSYRVHEAVTVVVRDGDESLGEIFLTHGHQGTLDSDRFAAFSRWVVRWLWRPVQRILKIGSNTPSKDYGLRLKHELAMHAWASSKDGVVLIAGHTHHPVFCSQSHESQLTAEIAGLTVQLSSLEDGAEKAEMDTLIDRKQQELDRLLKESEGKMVARPDSVRPCYFNTGCCSFSDGDITGLEIAGGDLKLVRWSKGAGVAEVLRRAPLREVFQRIRSGEDGG